MSYVSISWCESELVTGNVFCRMCLLRPGFTRLLSLEVSSLLPGDVSNGRAPSPGFPLQLLLPLSWGDIASARALESPVLKSAEYPATNIEVRKKPPFQEESHLRGVLPLPWKSRWEDIESGRCVFSCGRLGSPEERWLSCLRSPLLDHFALKPKGHRSPSRG